MRYRHDWGGQRRGGADSNSNAIGYTTGFTDAKSDGNAIGHTTSFTNADSVRNANAGQTKTDGKATSNTASASLTQAEFLILQFGKENPRVLRERADASYLRPLNQSDDKGIATAAAAVSCEAGLLRTRWRVTAATVSSSLPIESAKKGRPQASVRFT